MSDLTELQRCILRQAYQYPRYSQQDIAEYCDCSPSYVSQVLNKYDDIDAFQAQVRTLPGLDVGQIQWDTEPVWMQETDWGTQEFDDQLGEDVEEGMKILGQWLANGYKGLQYLIRKIR